MSRNTDSPPGSGYSLDNLAPAVPQNFVFETGDLSWEGETLNVARPPLTVCTVVHIL